MARSLFPLLGLLAVAPLARPDDDPIRARLDKAKGAYETASDRLRKEATAWFDRREDLARKDGNKKALDEVKAERQAFVTAGTLPSTVPVKLKQGYESAAGALTAAYERAVKEYTKAKQDEEAEAVEKELAALKKGNDPPALKEPKGVKNRLVGKWAWGPDRHVLTFTADGKVTEQLPGGKPGSPGTWKAESDGTVTVLFGNGFVTALTLSEDGTRMKIDLTDPAGRKFVLAGERLAK